MALQIDGTVALPARFSWLLKDTSGLCRVDNKTHSVPPNYAIDTGGTKTVRYAPNIRFNTCEDKRLHPTLVTRGAHKVLKCQKGHLRDRQTGPLSGGVRIIPKLLSGQVS